MKVSKHQKKAQKKLSHTGIEVITTRSKVIRHLSNEVYILECNRPS